jgi:hypothetical protein
MPAMADIQNLLVWQILRILPSCDFDVLDDIAVALLQVPLPRDAIATRV